MTLLRSWMFVPGNQSGRLAKVSQLPSDVFIIDLEDAVAPDAKPKARHMFAEAAVGWKRQTVYLRVNELDSEWFPYDACAAVAAGIRGIILPKVALADHITRASAVLHELELRRGVASGTTEIVPLIESALAVYNAGDIASADPRVQRLAFGSVDYSLDINARLSKDGTELLYARSRLVVVSRAFGIDAPIDAVFIDIKDRLGLARDAAMARQLGFQGKMLVHPDQIDIVNLAFTPTKEEVDEAVKIVSVYDEASRRGEAAVQWSGKMIDLPVVEKARRLLRDIGHSRLRVKMDGDKQ